MSNIPTDPHDPYRYRVDPIEHKRQAEEQGRSPEWKKEGELPFFSALLRLFQKVVGKLDADQKKKVAGEIGEALRAHLEALKRDFSLLQKGGAADSVEFVENFATHWQFLMEDAFRLGRRTPFSLAFYGLMGEIERHPEGKEHSLGYYLEKSPGDKWLPSPFRELLEGLTKEHEKNGSKSVLSHWVQRIEELLQQLSS